jgi:hypothetical protein
MNNLENIPESLEKDKSLEMNDPPVLPPMDGVLIISFREEPNTGKIKYIINSFDRNNLHQNLSLIDLFNSTCAAISFAISRNITNLKNHGQAMDIEEEFIKYIENNRISPHEYKRLFLNGMK